MRGAVYRGVRQVVLEEVPEPVTGPHDVLMSVAACGLCGSDLRWYTHGGPTLGTVMGHEFAGAVIEVGSAVEGVVIGDRVAVNPLVPCGTCPRCREGSHNLCAQPAANTGGFADRLLVRGASTSPVFVLPAGVDTDAAAVLEPLACAVRAVRLGRPPTSEPAVVVGLGAIGLCVVQVLRAAGVEVVIGVDVSQARLALAGQLGASAVVDARRRDVTEALRSLVGHGRSGTHALEWAQVATVFECSGAPSVLADALDGMVRSGGTVVVVGLTETPPAPDLTLLVRKELRLIGSLAYGQADFDEAVRLLLDGRVELGRLITHRVPLARIDEAYAQAFERDTAVKVVVVP